MRGERRSVTQQSPARASSTTATPVSKVAFVSGFHEPVHVDSRSSSSTTGLLVKQ